VAEFGGIVVGNDAELLHRVHRESGELLRPREADRVGNVAPVECEVLVAGAPAGYAEHRIILCRSRSGIDHHHTGRQSSQRGRGPVRQGQARQHLPVHRLRDVGGLRLRDRSRLFHRDRRGLLADLQQQIHAERLGHLKDHRAAGEMVEARGIRLDPVAARDQRGEPVNTGGVRDGLQANPSVYINDQDFGVRDGQLAGVLNSAGNRAIAALRVGSEGGEEESR
jgi:hypothetical protein